jgi:MFS transporter, DHA1 family, inner membrane transport protein
MSRAAPSGRPLNFRVLAPLALGTFAIGTGSFVFAGLLGSVARDLSVSVGTAGQLITAYAIAYALLSPIVVTLANRVSRRRLLVVSLAVFTAANVAAVVLPSYLPLMISRIVAAVGGAAFTPTAIAVAAQLAAPERRGRALATVTGGLTVAFAFGIPLGTLIGDAFGWRAAFVLVGSLGAGALVGLAAVPGDVPLPERVGLRERVRTAARPDVLAVLVLTALGLGAGFVIFAYIDPLLRAITGFGGRGVSVLLLIFGVAGIAGNALGGYGADRYAYRRCVGAIFCVLVLSFAALSALRPFYGSGFATFASSLALVAWSVAGWALAPFQQYRLVEILPGQANVLLSLNASAIYLGQGAGAGIGALALLYGSTSVLGWIAALCVLPGFLLLLPTRARTKPPSVLDSSGR